MANRKDLTIRYFQFFDHYLKDAPAPKWMTEGVAVPRQGHQAGAEVARQKVKGRRQGDYGAKSRARRRRRPSVSVTLSADSAVSRCAGRRGPTIAASICGWCSTHASASAPTSTPRARASSPSCVEAPKHRVTLEMTVRLRPQRHPRAVGILSARLVLARQPAAGERTERGEPDARVGAQREHLALLRAIEQAVGVLHPVEARQPAALADPDAPAPAATPRCCWRRCRAPCPRGRSRRARRSVSSSGVSGSGSWIRYRSSRSVCEPCEAGVDLA